ncbi:MAG: hypothetical protein NC122_08190 [Faecalibacterium sp.]|nr:hypothetical protein [Ruminococcus sp.]MCM1392454.1 hypothetical protein [Ruminococcus sp.]MCM1486173.1 hypothetical protein [Faecalibacterium sp.]
MKKIFIPVAVIVVILAIVAIILSKTSGTGDSELGYHTHANGEIHYDSGEVVTSVQESHTHADGEVHYGSH